MVKCEQQTRTLGSGEAEPFVRSPQQREALGHVRDKQVRQQRLLETVRDGGALLMRQSGWRWGGGAQYAAPAHWPRIHPPPPHPGLTSGPTPPPGHTSSPPTTARHPAPPTGHASPLPAPSSASRQAGRGAPRGVITARLEEGLANIVCEDLDRVWSPSQPPKSARKPETTTDGTGTTGRLQ